MGCKSRQQTFLCIQGAGFLWCHAASVSYMFHSSVCLTLLLTVPDLLIYFKPHMVFRSFVSFGHTHVHTDAHKHCKHILPGSSNHFINHSFQIICWTHLSLCFSTNFWFSGLFFTQEWTECGFMYLKHSNLSYEELDPFQACLNQGDFDEDWGKIQSAWWQFYGMFMILGLHQHTCFVLKMNAMSQVVQKITRNNY